MNPTITSWSDTQKLLAFLVVASFIIIIAIWMFHPPATDQATTGVLNTLVGTLGGMAGMVMTFYFGSSRGERNKDDTIATIAQAPAMTTSGNGAAQPSTGTATPSAG